MNGEKKATFTHLSNVFDCCPNDSINDASFEIHAHSKMRAWHFRYFHSEARQQHITAAHATKNQMSRPICSWDTSHQCWVHETGFRFIDTQWIAGFLYSCRRWLLIRPYMRHLLVLIIMKTDRTRPEAMKLSNDIENVSSKILQIVFDFFKWYINCSKVLWYQFWYFSKRIETTKNNSS